MHASLKLSARIFAAMMAAMPVFAGPAGAASLIKQHNDWASYAHQGSQGKLCYILARPSEQQPTDRDHGDVFFILARRGGPDGTVEPEFRVGYAFRDDSVVTLDIDGEKLAMFTRGKGAWMETRAGDAQVVDAMKAGSRMTLSAESRRGTRTQYVYSLSGVTASLGDIEACQ